MPAVPCLLLDACCPMPAARCLMSDACCPMPAARCLLADACCLMPAARCLLSDACCPMPGVLCLVSDACCGCRLSTGPPPRESVGFHFPLVFLWFSISIAILIFIIILMIIDASMLIFIHNLLLRTQMRLISTGSGHVRDPPPIQFPRRPRPFKNGQCAIPIAH